MVTNRPQLLTFEPCVVGFKISYTSRLRTKLTTAHQQQASQALADEWARRANNNKIGDFTGTGTDGCSP